MCYWGGGQRRQQTETEVAIGLSVAFVLCVVGIVAATALACLRMLGFFHW